MGLSHRWVTGAHNRTNEHRAVAATDGWIRRRSIHPIDRVIE